MISAYFLMFDQYSYFTFKYYQLLALVAVKIGSGNFTFAGVGGYFGMVSVGSQIVRLVVMTRRLEGSELRRICCHAKRQLYGCYDDLNAY